MIQSTRRTSVSAGCSAILILCYVCSVSQGEDKDAVGHTAELMPDSTSLQALASNPDEQPVVILRLLKYSSRTGPESCRKYLEQTVPLLQKSGGEVLYYGEAKTDNTGQIDKSKVFGWRANPWDGMVLEKYRSRNDYLKLTESEAYQAAMNECQQGLDKTILYALNGTRRPVPGVPPIVDKVNRQPDHPAPAFYMLNLLKFKPDGTELYYEKYGKVVAHMIVKKYHGKIIHGLKREHAARRARITGRRRRPSWQSTSMITGSPAISTCGFAQCEPRGQSPRGSMRSSSLASSREQYTSFGVLPFKVI